MELITPEWAKQLAFDAGLIDASNDYAKMKIIYGTPGIHSLQISYFNPEFRVLTFDIFEYYDAINGEYHRLGYAPQGNVLLVET